MCIRDRRKGKTPPNVPERVGNLWLTYDFDPAWQGGVDARYVSSVYALSLIHI